MSLSRRVLFERFHCSNKKGEGWTGDREGSSVGKLKDSTHGES